MRSQEHGFIIEKEIKEKIFNYYDNIYNNTDIHDIPFNKNIMNKNENISIKTTKSNTIDFGDIFRMFNYDFTKINTIIVVKYKQVGNFKIITNIYEINYTKFMHTELFGTIKQEEIDKYIQNIKNIPPGKCNKDIRSNYLNEKKQLKRDNNMKINISPKVDNKSQRRVQCSLSKFQETLYKYITFSSSPDQPNVIRGVEISKSIISQKRIRHSKLD